MRILSSLMHLQDASLPDSVPSTSGLSEAVRLTSDAAPVFSLVADSTALGDSHNQVFCGNLGKSIEAWEPPDSHLIEKVHLNGHTGWVRGLATSSRWLFRYIWHLHRSNFCHLQVIVACKVVWRLIP